MMAKERNRKTQKKRPSEFLGETQGGTQRKRGVDNQPEEEQLDWDKTEAERQEQATRREGKDRRAQ